MKKFLTLFYLIAVLFSVSLSAMADTWTYTWDKNKASGGQGFLNPSNKELLSQTAEINGINWTFVSNTYATYFAKNGQQFGTANNPVLHGVLSTSDLSGKIKSVSFDVKKKTAEQDVAVSVQVNGKVYGTSASLTTDVVTYTFTPAEGTEEEGKIEVIFDQKENNTGTIIFIKMTIEYEGDGSSTTTVVDLKDPELDFAVKEVTMYASDEEEPINNPLTNPFNLSPIVYKSSDNTVAVPDKNGDVYSPGKVGEAVIYAIFEGNEEYRVDTASFVVKMVEKPTVDPNPVDDSPLKADFASDESKTTYYQMGWDSTDEAETWSYYGKVERPWTLTKAPAISGTNSFNTIDEDSKLSLTVRGNDEIELKERAISPYMTVMSKSEVEFYACFHGVWVVNGRWKLNIYDSDNGGVQETLVDGFMYAQETGFVGPNWIRFNVPLEKYAGHRCAFEFSYEGMGGESVSFDGFKLNQVSEASDAAINVVVGQSVHFKSTGTGTPDSYEWTFEGGDVATSTDAAPVVTYFTPGEYSVTLVVHRGEEKDEMTKEKVVVVKEAAPTAWIGAIEDSYYSPWVYSFVPTNVPVKFTNESTGYPTSFNWTFEGTDIATSTDATPTVTYTSVGVFDVKLEVANSVGKNKDELGDAIQAGGTQDVWNIANNELEVFDVATIYGGYYGGSNLYGMNAYAEHFHKPLAPASVDGATIYFAYTTSEDPDALMTVSLCFADENGLPGKPVASKSLKISELAYDEEKIVGTKFMFDEAVDVDSEFFITVSGFPVLDAKNKVVMFAVCRDYGSFTSTCHLLEDEDENYNPLGTYTWYKNEEAISFLLTAHLTYKETVSTSIDAPRNVAEGKSIFTLDGRKVENADKAGVYVVREGNNVRKITVK